jgi:hypothetical protein
MSQSGRTPDWDTLGPVSDLRFSGGKDAAQPPNGGVQSVPIGKRPAGAYAAVSIALRLWRRRQNPAGRLILAKIIICKEKNHA